MKFKLPKCIKKSGKEAVQNFTLPASTVTSGDRLLLTDSTFSIQSRSSSVSLFKSKKRVMFIIEDYKFINDKLYTIQPKNQNTKELSVSIVTTTKKQHGTAKRLQRNKMHVKSRPTRYCRDQS